MPSVAFWLCDKLIADRKETHCERTRDRKQRRNRSDKDWVCEKTWHIHDRGMTLFHLRRGASIVVKRYYKSITVENQPRGLSGAALSVKSSYAIGVLFEQHLIDLGNVGDHFFGSKVWIDMPPAVLTEFISKFRVLE